MNNFLTILSLALLITSCSESAEKQTELNEGQLTKTEDGLMLKQILVAANQFASAKEIKINGHKFDLVLQEKDTTYLSTSDSLFQTPEGYHIGTSWGEIPKTLRGRLSKEPGFGYYIRLSSGWNLGFCEGTSCTDSDPVDSSKVKWIFKRNS